MVSFDSYWCLFDSPVGPISAEFCSRLSDEMLPSCGHGNRYRSTEANSSDEPRLKDPWNHQVSSQPCLLSHRSQPSPWEPITSPNPSSMGQRLEPVGTSSKTLQLAMSHHLTIQNPLPINASAGKHPLCHTWLMVSVPLDMKVISPGRRRNSQYVLSMCHLIRTRGYKMIHNDLWSSVKS